MLTLIKVMKSAYFVNEIQQESTQHQQHFIKMSRRIEQIIFHNKINTIQLPN